MWPSLPRREGNPHLGLGLLQNSDQLVAVIEAWPCLLGLCLLVDVLGQLLGTEVPEGRERDAVIFLLHFIGACVQ